MARPIKHNADYFSHDNNMRNDIKIKAVRRKYNAAGYALYIMILELLTSNEYFEIEWNEENIELLSPDFDMDTEVIIDIVNYCIKLNLLQITNGYLHCNTLTERLEETLLLRRKGYCSNNSKRMSMSGVNVNNNSINVDIYPQSKVKESKVNKSKEKESIVNEIEDYEMHEYMDYKFAKDSLDKLTEYIDDNNIPAAKKLLSDIKEDYGSFDNILQLCYGNDTELLKNWTNYFNNTLQFIN